MRTPGKNAANETMIRESMSAEQRLDIEQHILTFFDKKIVVVGKKKKEARVIDEIKTHSDNGIHPSINRQQQQHQQAGSRSIQRRYDSQ